LFQPGPQVNKDFYAELPIKMRLTGSYHSIGAFVSGIAALPRIVTLHDVEITPAGRDAGLDELQLDVTAKTYRYLDEEEQAAAQPAAPRRRRSCPGRLLRSVSPRTFIMSYKKHTPLAAAVMLALGGCSSDLDELERQVAEIKSRPGERIEPLPEI